MIDADRIGYEYIRRDEHGEVVAVETALDAVSFRVDRGSFVGILGENGSGKSTLAKHLNAILIPESGTLWVDGIDTSEEGVLFKVRRRVGMIFQNPDNQIVATRVEDDVAFGPENLGVPAEELRTRVDDALAKVDMTNYATTSPDRLSGGQKSRVAIAGVLAMHPSCMVFDESTAMLDPNGRIEVLREVEKLHAEGITIIWITHYSEELIGADRIFVMHEGKLTLEGTPREIFSQADTLETYGLEVPPLVSLARELRNKGINLPLDILTIDDLLNHL